MTNSNRPVEVSAEAFAKLRTVSTATLTTQLMKRGLRNTFLTGLYPLRPDIRMVGYAFTLRYLPAREDLVDELYDNTRNVQRLAVETVEKDDVLVIDARGEIRAATLGNILATRLKARGAAGIVTDGALRDTPNFKEMALPAYIKAAQATTSFAAHHPIDMGLPISCAGVLIMPGDIMVGDGEGVVAIPSKIAEEVARDAYEQERMEEFIQAKVAAGASIVGVYPPNETTKAEYEEWKRTRGHRTA
jgi:regulator of RNase E activity RraA